MKLQNILMLLVVSTILITGVAKADNYSESVINHVITQKLINNDMDHKEVTKSELKRKAHGFTLGLLSFVFNDKPQLLDGVSAWTRQSSDKIYKCSLQGDYKNKDCR